MRVIAQGKVKYKGKFYHEKEKFEHENPEKAIIMGLVVADEETEIGGSTRPESEIQGKPKATRKRGRNTLRS